MRLIDADALPKYTGYALSANEVAKAVENAPTIYAEPVRRGKWIDMGDFEKCSFCSGTRLKAFQSYYGKTAWIKTPYCPNCGAKMEVKE